MRFLLLLLVTSMVRVAPAQEACIIETFAGGAASFSGDGGPASEAEFFRPEDFVLGPGGEMYIADTGNQRIRKVGLDGVITTIAGNGVEASTGDGGLAVDASLASPSELAADMAGNVYVRESTGYRIRRIGLDGVISTVAGNGQAGFSGDGGQATLAQIDASGGMDADAGGNLYFADRLNHRVRRVSPDGMIATIAGSGPTGELNPHQVTELRFAGDGMPATETILDEPRDVAWTAGELFIADSLNGRIRKVSPDGLISTVAGRAFGLDLPSGQPSVAEFTVIGAPRQLAITPTGTVAFSTSSGGSVVRGVYEVTDGMISRAESARHGSVLAFDVSGNGVVHTLNIGDDAVVVPADDSDFRRVAGAGGAALAGDGGPASNAHLRHVDYFEFDDAGSVYIADSVYGRIRVVRPDGTISTVAGNGNIDVADTGLPATETSISGRDGIALFQRNRLWIANFVRILEIGPNGAITVLGGSSGCNDLDCGDGGPVERARFRRIRDMATGPDGSVYLLDELRGSPEFTALRRVTPNGIVDRWPRGEDGAHHVFDRPSEIDAGSNGDVFVRDRQGLWRVTAAGDVIRMPNLFGGPRGSLRFHSPTTDDAGVTYGNPEALSRVIAFSSPDDVDQIAGARLATDGFRVHSGDGGPARDATMPNPHQMLVGDDGHLYISFSDRIRRIRDVANCRREGVPTFSGDGVVQAASFQTGFAPGTIISIFGRQLGPDQVALASVGPEGFPFEVGGTRVWVDAKPAPVIFASANQVNAIVPFGDIDVDPDYRLDPVEVERNGLRSVGSFHPTSAHGPTAPGLFTANGSGVGQAAALNEDASLNTSANPAGAGSVIVLFGTGAGQTDPPGRDGRIAGAPLPQISASVTVLIGGVEAEVLYAGAAPGLVEGVFQVNARIPDGLPAGAVEVTVQVGEAVSAPREPVTIAVGN